MKILRGVLFLSALLCMFPGSPEAAGEGRPSRTAEERQVVYVSPFQAVMVPAEVGELIFDLLIDRLNEQGAPLGYRFVILKETADPQWLGRQLRIDGELFGYLEESGCCFTEIRLKTRVQLHRPGERTPLAFDYPRELFFSHERTSIEAERRQLAEEIAATLANRLLAALPVS